MSNRGWTLIELLIAICISAIICIGMMQFYLFSRQAYRLLQQTARLQENGRAAAHILQQDLRSAGFTGCMQFNRLSAVNNGSRSIKTAIRGDNSFLSTLPIYARKLPGTDAIFLQRLNTQLVDIRKVDQNSIELYQTH